MLAHFVVLLQGTWNEDESLLPTRTRGLLHLDTRLTPTRPYAHLHKNCRWNLTG